MSRMRFQILSVVRFLWDINVIDWQYRGLGVPTTNPKKLRYHALSQSQGTTSSSSHITFYLAAVLVSYSPLDVIVTLAYHQRGHEFNELYRLVSFKILKDTDLFRTDLGL